MDNIIDNYLYVFGKNEDDIVQFKLSIRDLGTGAVFSFKEMIPPPEDADKNWYYENWGEGNGIRDSKLRYMDNKMLNYYFESPWVAPSEGVKKLALRYPSLYFCLKYSDRSGGEGGGKIFKQNFYTFWEFVNADMFPILKTCFDIGFGTSDGHFGASLQKILKLIEENDHEI
jgi:hypothetical protein